MTEKQMLDRLSSLNLSLEQKKALIDCFGGITITFDNYNSIKFKAFINGTNVKSGYVKNVNVIFSNRLLNAIKYGEDIKLIVNGFTNIAITGKINNDTIVTDLGGGETVIYVKPE